MALANIAVLLAREHQRILIVDWDLEAPGLERYFDYFSISPSGAGLLPMLTDASKDRYAPYQDYTWTIHVDSGSPITFLPSGRERDSVGYAGQLERFDWKRFFRRGGGDYLEELRREWKKDFDLVLIDSRTGLSDTGGICTIQLPDIVVVMFTASNQSFLGARDVMRHVRKARQALAYPRMELTVFPLPARISSPSQAEESQKWIDRFSEELGEFYEDWLPSWAQPGEVLQKVKIPQDDSFGFGEKLPVVEQGVSDPGGMGYVYSLVAQVLKNDFQQAHEVLGLRERVGARKGVARRVESEEDYKWHLYVSHPSLTYLETWLDEFLQHLKSELSHLLNEEPRIFFDRQEVVLGTSWPDKVRDALRRSRLLLPVLTPAYFQSEWNVAEWRTFEERESMTTTPGELIFPISLQDTERYPVWARERELADASSFTARARIRWTDSADQFVTDVADAVARRLGAVPPFRAEFPIVDPTTVTVAEAERPSVAPVSKTSRRRPATIKRLPIIYVPGYTESSSGINRHLNDPFYGFNDGSRHIRVDGDGELRLYHFESPLLRLMIDEDYQLFARGDQHQYLLDASDGSVPAASLWVYRFYDQVATTFMRPPHENVVERLYGRVHQHVTADGFGIESAAAGLYDLIMLIREKTGAEKIYLVAHSMGGLVARSMLQKVSQNKDVADNTRIPARHLVERFFTYATPHGGIDFNLSTLDWTMEAFGPNSRDIFAPEKMYGYLEKDARWGDKAPAWWDPQEIPAEIFDRNRIFCLVGTNPADSGPSSEVAGPKSDGLVNIDRAYVRGANRAFVHRSHSGRYGQVNSEEGYQNLRRFLFGAYEMKADLRGLPPHGQRADETWQADLRLTVRGLPIVLHEQLAAHYCPIQLFEQEAPIPLTTVFLLDPAQSGDGQDHLAPLRCRHTLSLRVFHLQQLHGSFLWRNHLEQVADWEDTLIVDMDSADTMRAWVAWNSVVFGPPDRYDPITEGLPDAADRKPCEFVQDGSDLYYDVPLPVTSRTIPIFGDSAHLRLTVYLRD